jgi:outer membrane cobalamin receptor
LKIIVHNFALGSFLFFALSRMVAQDIESRPSPPYPRTTVITRDSTNTGVSSRKRKYSPAVDTLRKWSDTSSLAHADSVIIDSVRIRFLAGMGQISQGIDTTDILYQKQFLWSDAKNIEDLLWKLPGFFYRDLGEAGKWGQLNACGTDDRDIDILLDGRPMNDPVTGTYNLSDLPLEFIDHTEILSGSTSILASGEDGTALNFVSRSYNSYHPFTKLRFVQDPKGTLLTDGLFTQNVARGLNLMIGFQRTVTVGRYANADLDAWNVRMRLRYNLSDRFNVSLTDFYTKAGNGLNGGIDPIHSASLFDETGAAVLNENSRDSRSRHDVTLSAIARLFSDSSSVTQSSLYYSAMDREYLDPVNQIDDSTKASFWGIRLQQQLFWNALHVTVGGNWERRQSDSTRTLLSHVESEQSLFARAELQLITLFVPSITVRSNSLDGEYTVSSGIGAKSMPADWLTVFFDASRYDRFPTLQERYWSDSVVVRTQYIVKEQHSYLQGGVDIHPSSNIQLNLTGFHRTIKNAIVYQPALTMYGSSAISISNVNEITSSGLNGRLIFNWHHIEVLGVMTLTHYEESDTVKTFTPDVILSGEVCYRGNIVFEHWDGKIGFRSRFFSRQKGMQFDPHTLSYIEYTSDLLGRSTTFDLFLILKIGNAHLSLSWNNILNAGYMLGPIYPMQGSSVRFGVNWEFID